MRMHALFVAFDQFMVKHALSSTLRLGTASALASTYRRADRGLDSNARCGCVAGG